MTGDGAASRLPTPVEVVHRPRSRNHSPPLPASRRLAPSVAIGLGLRMLAAGPAHFLTVLLAEAAMSAARELNKPGSCDARHGCRVAGIPAVPCSLAQLRNTRSRVDAASASSSSGEESVPLIRVSESLDRSPVEHARALLAALPRVALSDTSLCTVAGRTQSAIMVTAWTRRRLDELQGRHGNTPGTLHQR